MTFKIKQWKYFLWVKVPWGANNLVDTWVPPSLGIDLDNPKSASLSWKFSSNKMFVDLTSQCIIGANTLILHIWNFNFKRERERERVLADWVHRYFESRNLHFYLHLQNKSFGHNSWKKVVESWWFLSRKIDTTKLLKFNELTTRKKINIFMVKDF